MVHFNEKVRQLKTIYSFLKGGSLKGNSERITELINILAKLPDLSGIPTYYFVTGKSKYLFYHRGKNTYIYYCDRQLGSGSSNHSFLSSYYFVIDYTRKNMTYAEIESIVSKESPVYEKNVIRISIHPDDLTEIVTENLYHQILYELTSDARTDAHINGSSICLPKELLVSHRVGYVACIMAYHTPLPKAINEIIRKNVYRHNDDITDLFNLYYAKIKENLGDEKIGDLSKFLRNDTQLIKSKAFLNAYEGQITNFENEIKLYLNDIFRTNLSDEFLRGFLHSHKEAFHKQFVEQQTLLFRPKFKEIMKNVILMIEKETSYLNKNFEFCHGDLTYNNIVCDFDSDRNSNPEIKRLYFIDFGFSKFRSTVTFSTRNFNKLIGEDKTYIPNNDLAFFILHTYFYIKDFLKKHHILIQAYEEIVRDLFIDPSLFNRVIDKLNQDIPPVELLYPATEEKYNKLVRKLKIPMFSKNIKLYLRRDLKEAILN